MQTYFELAAANNALRREVQSMMSAASLCRQIWQWYVTYAAASKGFLAEYVAGGYATEAPQALREAWIEGYEKAIAKWHYHLDPRIGDGAVENPNAYLELMHDLVQFLLSVQP